MSLSFDSFISDSSPASAEAWRVSDRSDEDVPGSCLSLESANLGLSLLAELGPAAKPTRKSSINDFLKAPEAQEVRDHLRKFADRVPKVFGALIPMPTGLPRKMWRFPLGLQVEEKVADFGVSWSFTIEDPRFYEILAYRIERELGRVKSKLIFPVISPRLGDAESSTLFSLPRVGGNRNNARVRKEMARLIWLVLWALYATSDHMGESIRSTGPAA